LTTANSISKLSDQLLYEMKNRYEGLLILNVKGSEDGAKEVIERLEADFKKEGAPIEQVQKMGNRQFSYSAGDLGSGFYVNFVFHAEPVSLARLHAKLTLDETVYRQHYLRIGAAKPVKVRTPRAA
jgi:small subunit ribosomal protein S6